MNDNRIYPWHSADASSLHRTIDMLKYGCSECAGVWLVMRSIVAQIVVLWMFSFCGHTDTYRTVCRQHGAFELCLPSLGFFFTKLTLRSQLLGQHHRMTKVRVGGRAWSVCNIMPCRPCVGIVGAIVLWGVTSLSGALRWCLSTLWTGQRRAGDTSPSSSWSRLDSVGVYSLGSSLWPMLESLWIYVSLCEYLIQFIAAEVEMVKARDRRRYSDRNDGMPW